MHPMPILENRMIFLVLRLPVRLLKVLMFIIFVMTLVSCGTPEQDAFSYKTHRFMKTNNVDKITRKFQPQKSDGRAIPYIERFEKLSGKSIDFPVVFGKIDGDDIAGRCDYTVDGTNMVTINEDYWHHSKDGTWESVDGGMEYFREIIIFHELSHCALGKRYHNNNMKKIYVEDYGAEFEMPESIMHEEMPYVIDIYPYLRGYYFKELFN